MKSRFTDKYFHYLFYGGFLLGLALSILYSTNQILTGDQTQMLFKGYLGAQTDTWLSYGNAASAVGHVPGSLSALIVGVPLLVWDSPQAPMFFLIFLHVISFFLLDSVIKQIFDRPVRLLFLLLYWLNPWFLFENILYNPSYLFLFSAMHFWSAFNMRERKSGVYAFIHLLSIGMAMQLHYSWVLLAVISSYLFYRKLIVINWWGLIAAGLLILVSLAPYLQEALVNPDIAKEESDRYIGWGGVHVYPVLKATLYWFKYGSLLYSSKLMFGSNFEWFTSIQFIQVGAKYLWQGLMAVLGGLSLWVTFKANKLVWYQVKSQIIRKPGNTSVSSEAWMQLYAFSALLAVIVSSVLSPIIFSYWHLISIFPFAILPLLYLARQWRVDNAQKFSTYALYLTAYFLLVNLIAAHDSRKFSYQVSYSEQTIEYIEQQLTE